MISGASPLRALGARIARLARPRYPVVRQYDLADCGPAALLSVLRYWGGDASLVQVRELSATDARGSTLLSLLQAAQALGFEASGATGEYEELRKVEGPCIAHVVMDERLHHYVVVYHAGASRVVVGDPGRGRVTLSREEFLRIWKRRAVLLLRPTPALRRSPAPHWIRWIAQHFRREETWLVQSVFLGVAYTALGLLTAVFVQWLIDRFIPEKSLPRILWTGAFLLLLQTLRGLAGFLRQRFLVELNKRVSIAVTGEFLAHLFRLPSRFFDTRKKGDITSRINDAVKIQNALLRTIGVTIVDALVIAGSLAFMFFLAPALAWVALATVPVYGAILLLATRRIRREQSEVMASYAQVESSYIDSLDGIEEIRGFNAGGVFAALNGLLFGAYQDRTETLGKTQARISLYAELAGGALVMAVLVYGAVLVTGGSLQLGQMMAAYSLLAGMLPATGRLVEANIALQGASAAATRLMDLLLVEPEPNEGRAPFRMERALGIRGGRFVWPRGQVLFDGIELSVERGRLGALCGLSGAGKSTLVKVLERKYPLASGELLLDGAPASHVELGDYRRNVVVVPETVKIFNGTLADNILMGRAIPGPEWLAARLEAMEMAPFLARFEGGLLARVGEDGRQLSSGERQVVGLVRALLTEPAVLVMDEGINAIDVQLAGLILRTLEEYAREHAVLLISHNLRTLVHADHLYLLEGGAIVQSGSPRELLALPGRFQELWKMQEAHIFAEV
jgi:ATP-binding cassette subfamily B protein